jgi:hypothetical protein
MTELVKRNLEHQYRVFYERSHDRPKRIQHPTSAITSPEKTLKRKQSLKNRELKTSTVATEKTETVKASRNKTKERGINHSQWERVRRGETLSRNQSKKKRGPTTSPRVLTQ